jgi:hypothetical protein
MDLATRWNHPEVDLQAARPSGHCAICRKCTSSSMFTLHERVNPAGAGQTWLLCEGCAAAVVTEVDRAALRTPLRLRIAVGVVAASRRPMRRLTIFDRDFWELMPRQKLGRMIIGFVVCMFALPPLLFLLVLAITSLSAALR